MKVLYGIQGTGNGHITRARAMAKALADKGIETQFLVSGRAKDKLFDMAPFGDYWWREGLTFQSNQGRLVLRHTVAKSRPAKFTLDVRALDLSDFDLIVSDYEPIVSWAGRRARRKVIGLGHQYAFSHNVPLAKASLIDRLVLKNFAPATLELGLHWHHFGMPVLPPVAPVPEHSGQANQPFILVYLPFESMDEIRTVLAQFKTHQFIIYHPDASPGCESNLQWCKPDREQFPKDLAQCAGVICNAGFELASETLQLGKKLLVKPMLGQVEQQSNALALRTLGWGHTMQSLDAHELGAWLSSDNPVQIHYPDTAAAVADFIAAGAEEHDLPALSRSLWQQTQIYVPAVDPARQAA